MIVFILLILAFIGFAAYRYKNYKKQREIEEMAADAQAYVSAEVVELLQRYKTLTAQNALDTEQSEKLSQSIRNLTENLFCHTDSEASVREYLANAKQDIVLIQNKLDQLKANPEQLNAFDELK